MNWKHVRKTEKRANAGETWSLALWLLNKLRRTRTTESRLALIDKISLAPKQSLALVEAEGRRFLVASSADGAAAFYPIEAAASKRPNRAAKARVAW